MASANLKKQFAEHAGWYILMVLAVAVSFWGLGKTINFPFNDYTHEIASAVLGCILTVVVTAVLIRQQTYSTAELNQKLAETQANAESQKEQEVFVYQAKIEVYKELMQQMEKIATMDRVEPVDLLKLQTLILRIAFVSDEGVLVALEDFVEELRRDIEKPNRSADEDEDEKGQDLQITRRERKRICNQFVKVSLAIRKELKITEICAQTTRSLQSIIDHLSDAGHAAQKQLDEDLTPSTALKSVRPLHL